MVRPWRKHVIDQRLDVPRPVFDLGEAAAIAVIVAGMRDCRDHEARFGQSYRRIVMAFERAAAAMRYYDQRQILAFNGAAGRNRLRIGCLLYTSLLYQVATAALSPVDVAWPIRHILRAQKNATVLMADVHDVDTAKKRLHTNFGDMPYDYLVIATGAMHSYFGHDEWSQVAPGLKHIEDRCV